MLLKSTTAGYVYLLDIDTTAAKIILTCNKAGTDDDNHHRASRSDTILHGAVTRSCRSAFVAQRQVTARLPLPRWWTDMAEPEQKSKVSLAVTSAALFCVLHHH
nr:hypothetical protein CFP56_53343 [Quercus suber]